MKGIINLVVGVCLSSMMVAQPSTQKDTDYLHKMEDTLDVLSYKMLQDTAENERYLACRMIIPKLVEGLQTPHSFDYPFDSLKRISIQYAPDSSFRIFTWQLMINENDFRYYGAIQMAADTLKLYPLIDRSHEIHAPDFKSLTADRWYGALYYNILQTEFDGRPVYLLFGFDANEFMSRKKLIDVLYFDQDQAHFGLPIFQFKDRNSPLRFMLEYSAESAVLLNWNDEESMIVYDHLINIPNPNGSGQLSVSDGSYEGFKWNPSDKQWNHVPMLTQNAVAEPPMVTPVDGQADPKGHKPKRDLFGRIRNK